MLLLAIDPGHEISAYVVLDTETGLPVSWEDKVDNWRLLYRIDGLDCERIAIERVTSFGKPVGSETFETVFWSGRFAERWRLVDDSEALRPSRMDVKHHLCHSGTAKDSHVRQALVDRFGGDSKAIGRKATGMGPLYGLTGHCWQALGVAVTAADGLKQAPVEQLAAF
jgi:hypothetical protein